MQILSYYNLKNIDYKFLDFTNQYIEKFPFKCYYTMEKLSQKDIVYIKDTTMIIDLIKLEEDMVINVFNFFKDMLRRNFIKKIVYKKEVLLVYFNNEFIISFFKNKDKWLIIPLVCELINKKNTCYFDVYIKNNNVYNYMFLVKVKDKFVTVDLKEMDKIDNLHYPLVLCFNNNKLHNLQFSFDKSVFLENFYNKIN